MTYSDQKTELSQIRHNDREIAMKLKHLRIRGKKKIYWLDLIGSDGKRIQKSLKTSNRQIAEEKLREIQGQVDRQVLNLKIRPDSIPLKQFISDYLIYCETNHGKRTLQLEKTTLEGHFAKFCEVNDIRALPHIIPAELEKYKKFRLTTAGPALINREVSILKAMVNRAVAEGRLHSNPLKGADGKPLVKKLQEPQGKIRFLSKEEIKKLLEAAESDPLWKNIIGVTLNTGLRRSELSHLKWENVDIARRAVAVTSDATFITKFGKQRFIPMNDTLVKIFSGIERKGTYVFGTRDDKPFQAHFNTRFNKIVKKAEIQNLVFHDLRHTFASHLCLAGVPLHVVKELMGHSSIAVTMIYSHMKEEHKHEAVGRLEALTS